MNISVGHSWYYTGCYSMSLHAGNRTLGVVAEYSSHTRSSRHSLQNIAINTCIALYSTIAPLYMCLYILCMMNCQMERIDQITSYHCNYVGAFPLHCLLAMHAYVIVLLPCKVYPVLQQYVTVDPMVIPMIEHFQEEQGDGHMWLALQRKYRCLLSLEA